MPVSCASTIWQRELRLPTSVLALSPVRLQPWRAGAAAAAAGIAPGNAGGSPSDCSHAVTMLASVIAAAYERG